MTSAKNARVNGGKSPSGKVSSLAAALRRDHGPMRSSVCSQENGSEAGSVNMGPEP